MSEGQEGLNQPVRKSSLVTVKKPLRKTSFVSFDENKTTIHSQETSEEHDISDKHEVGCEDKKKDCDEEEDIPIPYSRNWNDSLKINRRRSREEKAKMMKSFDG